MVGEDHEGTLRRYIKENAQHHGALYRPKIHRRDAYLKYLDDYGTLGYGTYDLVRNDAAAYIHSKLVRKVDPKVKKQMAETLLSQGILFGDARVVIALVRREDLTSALAPGPIPTLCGATNMPRATFSTSIMRNAQLNNPEVLWMLVSGGHRTAGLAEARATAADRLKAARAKVKAVREASVGFDLVTDEDAIYAVLSKQISGGEDGEPGPTTVPQPKKAKKGDVAKYESLPAAQAAFNIAFAEERKWTLISETYLGEWLIKFLDLGECPCHHMCEQRLAKHRPADLYEQLPDGMRTDIMEVLKANESLPQLPESKNEKLATAIYTYIQSTLSTDVAYREEQRRIWRMYTADPKWSEMVRMWEPWYRQIFELLNTMGVHGRGNNMFVLATVCKVYGLGLGVCRTPSDFPHVLRSPH